MFLMDHLVVIFASSIRHLGHWYCALLTPCESSWQHSFATISQPALGQCKILIHVTLDWSCIYPVHVYSQVHLKLISGIYNSSYLYFKTWQPPILNVVNAQHMTKIFKSLTFHLSFVHTKLILCKEGEVPGPTLMLLRQHMKAGGILNHLSRLPPLIQFFVKISGHRC